MRRLIAHNFSTLDGYAATTQGHPFAEIMSGPGGREIEQQVKHFLEGVDLLVLGAETYKLFAQYWPVADPDKEVLAERLNSLPKMVCSTSLQSAPWGDHPPLPILRNAMEELREIKSQPGKDILVFGSLSLCASLMQEGLLDEFHLSLAPFVLGGGVKIFGDVPLHAKFQLKDFQRQPQGVLRLEYLTTTGFTKEKVLEEFSSQARELIQLLESHQESVLRYKPSKDRWSIMQVGEHLLKSYDLSSLLRGKLRAPDRDPAEYLPSLRSNMLDYRQKSVADPRLYPDQISLEKEVLIERLRTQLAHLQEFGHREDLSQVCMNMEFPGSSYHLTRLEWLGFTTYHTRRHNEQIREVLQLAKVAEKELKQTSEGI